MATKENYCYRILKVHSVIVDFDGKPHLSKVPAVVEGETFKQWKMRILGPEVTNVVIYRPEEPIPQTRMHTLRAANSARHIERMFRDFGKTKDGKKQQAVDNAIADTTAKFSNVHRDTLEDLLAEKHHGLEPSIQDFFQRFIEENTKIQENISIENLLNQLIDSYNNTARIFREKNGY
ncbi:hypothetical protein RSG19_001558 [Yersinia enterocolitica]|nr:hypothetical protein [Yersinia enterocolitica]ELI8442231.1 hypothetical protein [Yersinia enterocolitica]